MALDSLDDAKPLARLCALSLSIILLLAEFFVDLPYPHFIAASIGLILVNGYVVYAYGVVSTPAVFTVMLTYPAMVPFITTYLYGIKNYAVAGYQFESVALASKVVSLVLLFLIAMLAWYDWLRAQPENPREYHFLKRIGLPYTHMGYVTLLVVFLGSAYIHDPGPTIFSVTYHESITRMPSWATWSGHTYKAAWALLLVMLADIEVDDSRFVLFSLATFAGTLWLILHGRRVESIGIITLFFGHLFWHRFDLNQSDLILSTRGRMLAMGFGLYMFVLFGIGRLRNWISEVSILSGSNAAAAGTNTSVGVADAPEAAGTNTSVGVADAPEAAVSTLNYGDGFIGVPGGANGFYASLRSTVYLFDHEATLLMGDTFIKYPIQAVPTPFLTVFGVTPPPRYTEFLSNSYNYNGGNYFLNVYYANFDGLGVIIAAIVLGATIYYIHTHIDVGQFHSNLATTVACVLFVNFGRALWYSQLNWVDALQGLVALLVLLFFVNMLEQRVLHWNR